MKPMQTPQNNDHEQQAGCGSADAACSAVWSQAVNTLASMCIADKIGTGPTKEAFILTLRLYADEMEKLIQPNSSISRESP